LLKIVHIVHIITNKENIFLHRVHQTWF
jgi:hypothetical protein